MKTKRMIAFVLSLCMAFCMAISASAIDIDTDGGSGNTPVYLSSTRNM